jgi:hypothetical protein
VEIPAAPRSEILAGVDFDLASSLASVDAEIIKIDWLDHSVLAWQVEHPIIRCFGKAVTQFRIKLLIVTESHDQIRDLDRSTDGPDHAPTAALKIAGVKITP